MIKNLIRNKFPLFFRTLKSIKGQDYRFLIGLPRISQREYNKKIHALDSGNELISEALKADHPFMLCRLGSAELTVILNYLYIKTKKINYWDIEKINQGLFRENAVFPTNETTLKQFAELYISCMPAIDSLAVWYNYGEHSLHKAYFKEASLIPIEALEPFRFEEPWSNLLKGKKVLVVHPFANSIKTQYEKRGSLFKNNKVLPLFDLITYKPFNSYTDIIPSNVTWFDILEKMKADLACLDFDIALIAAGPFGLPLAAFVKGMGKKAIHIGGALQLLFGIKGARWEERNEFVGFMNEFWIRPGENETPSLKVKNNIDNSSYW